MEDKEIKKREIWGPDSGEDGTLISHSQGLELPAAVCEAAAFI